MLHYVANALRGLLIGIAEIIPGISGGTIALITGIYDDLIDSIGHFFRALVSLVVPSKRKAGQHRQAFRKVKWGIILPVGAAMLAGIFLGAALLGPIIADYPVMTYAFFFGLILASLIIPIRMIGKDWNLALFIVAVVVAVITFFMLGLPRQEAYNSIPLPMVALSAAIAICALVLPGLSGSFILLVIGVYEPTIMAVNNRDWVYLLTFIVGAAIGIALFVSLLQWLLKRYRAITLTIMLGLMIGSLRALWPWQDGEANLLAPDSSWLLAVLFALAGIVVIGCMLIAEKLVTRLQKG